MVFAALYPRSPVKGITKYSRKKSINSAGYRDKIARKDRITTAVIIHLLCFFKFLSPPLFSLILNLKYEDYIKVIGFDMAKEEFDKSKTMIFPREVAIGHEVLEKTAELCDRLPVGNRPLVIYDPITKKIAGDKAIGILDSNGYEVSRFQCERGAVMYEVKRAISYAKECNSDFLMGVGGGSVIDVGKLAASRSNLPYISVPTSASHDGIASPRASIKDKQGSKILQLSNESETPLAVLADTSVIYKAPYRMLASGCGDSVSNLTAVKDWELGKKLKNEYLSSYAVALAKTAAILIIEGADFVRPGLEESAWIVTKALIVSGVSMSVARSSRPASGAEHMFSHMLDRLVPGKALHGEQCGIGAIMMMYLHGGDWKMIRDTLRNIGAPTTAKEIGIPKRTIVEALMHAHEVRPERYTILGNRGLTKEAAENLAMVTGVI
jgi:glycerol-1-phosphate dehydrogenase [NAD(P)+]